jgi:hypothetical protein
MYSVNSSCGYIHDLKGKCYNAYITNHQPTILKFQKGIFENTNLCVVCDTNDMRTATGASCRDQVTFYSTGTLSADDNKNVKDRTQSLAFHHNAPHRNRRCRQL